jgi:hypothetical protein
MALATPSLIKELWARYAKKVNGQNTAFSGLILAIQNA